jgi:SAM-dependent methyltransferase
MARKNISDNSPCWCGSPLKYKDCHRDIDSVGPHQRVTMARRVYEKSWSTNSAHINSQGGYKWMACLLQQYQPKRIFDVGCGIGIGLLELMNTLGDKLQIISIDENEACLQTAFKNIKAYGHKAVKIHRNQIQPVAEKAHVLNTITGKLKEYPGITLIESDILLDQELESFLTASPKFDAITCWLVGTHHTRMECVNLQSLTIKSGTEYRWRVQNRIYYLANKVLAVGGVLQVVDREQLHTNNSLTDACLDSHREQAARTSLEVLEVQQMKYEETTDACRVHMTINRGGIETSVDYPQLALSSVISIKR